MIEETTAHGRTGLDVQAYRRAPGWSTGEGPTNGYVVALGLGEARQLVSETMAACEAPWARELPQPPVLSRVAALLLVAGAAEKPHRFTDGPCDWEREARGLDLEAVSMGGQVCQPYRVAVDKPFEPFEPFARMVEESSELDELRAQLSAVRGELIDVRLALAEALGKLDEVRTERDDLLGDLADAEALAARWREHATRGEQLVDSLRLQLLELRAQLVAILRTPS